MTTLAQSTHQSTISSNLFFILSGEHESLPQAEVTAILESARLPFSLDESRYRLLTLEAAQQALRLVSERSLMFDSCGTILGKSEASDHGLRRLIRGLPIDKTVEGLKSFAVRSVRLGGTQKQLRRVDLERDVGAAVIEMVPRLRVNLDHPDVTFFCILSAESVILGISHFNKPSGMVAPRLPRRRPVFHPSTMPPKIARCMVNLARARPRTVFADPFCGVGGISLEASSIGCDVVALDASLRMVRGVRRNLRHYGLAPLGAVQGDARRTPLRGVEAIATDPPYGRDSSTMGIKITHLFRDFLDGVKEVLTSGSHMCISSPKELELETYARDAGLTVREKHLVRVHRSLTRQFVVLRNG